MLGVGVDDGLVPNYVPLYNVQGNSQHLEVAKGEDAFEVPDLMVQCSCLRSLEPRNADLLLLPLFHPFLGLLQLPP